MNPNQDPVRVRQIAWRRVLPILHLWRSVGAGLRLRTLIPAGVLVWLAEGFREVVSDLPPVAVLGARALPIPVRGTVEAMLGLLCRVEVQPLPFFATLSLLLIPVCMISRSAASDVFRNERLGLLNAGKDVLRRPASLAISTLLAVVIGAAILLALRIAGGVFAAENSLLIFTSTVCLIAGLFLLLVWLLSLSAIGIDQCSGSDALSRGISYCVSNKGFTILSLLLVASLSNATAFVADALQSAGEYIAAEQSDMSNSVYEQQGTDAADEAATRRFFPKCVQLSVFLSGLGLIYVTLRQKEDAVRLDEMDGGAPQS